MITRIATWAEVDVETYVHDKTGKTWRVTAYDVLDDKVTMVDREGANVTLARPPLDTPVPILEPSESEAWATVSGKLGATVLGQQDEAKAWKCPAFPTARARRLGDARSHLLLFHGVVTNDVKTMVGLIEAHESEQAEGWSHASNAHVHITRR